MSTNGTSRPPGVNPTADGLRSSETTRNTQGPFGGPWIGAEGNGRGKIPTPLHSVLPGQDMIGLARASYASASKVQLQPGAAAAAVAAAAAAIRNNAAAHAAFTAFAAQQASRNLHAGPATSSGGVFGETQASAAAAALLMSNAPVMSKHPRAVEADTPSASSLGATSVSGGLTSNSVGRGSSTRSNGTASSSGHHAGAAYCLIPQPAYDDDNDRRHLQQQQPPRPPHLSRTSSMMSRSGHSNNNSAMATAGPPSKLAAGGGTQRLQGHQYQQTRRGVGNSAATTTMKPPTATGPLAAVRRFRGGQASSTSLMPGSYSSTSRIEPQRRRLVGDASVGGGSERGTLSAHVRLERSREQNRQSSKKARVRRKGEEETLRGQIQSIQLFRLMVEEAPDMMSIHGLDHKVPFQYASSAFQRVAGINPRDVLGRGLTDLIVEDDRAAVQEALLKVVFSQASANVISYRMLLPAGGSLLVETSVRTGDQCIICVARAVAGRRPTPLQPPPPPVPLRAFEETNRTPSLCAGKGGAADGSGIISGGGEYNSSNKIVDDAAAAAIAATSTNTNTAAASTSKESKRDEDTNEGPGPFQGQTAAAGSAPPSGVPPAAVGTIGVGGIVTI